MFLTTNMKYSKKISFFLWNIWTPPGKDSLQVVSYHIFWKPSVNSMLNFLCIAFFVLIG